MAADDDFDRAWMVLVTRPEYEAWERQVRGIGGCENPVYLTGRTVTRDAASGEVLAVFSSEDLPYGRLMVPCGNRRSSRCEPCSRIYAGDAFHRIRAGMVGGKGIPTEVVTHPMVWLTLTAPSFGPVHTMRADASGAPLPCRPRRGGPRCEHGADMSCGVRHGLDDAVLGSPLCAECFDYAGAVLWNAHAGRLWHRFTDDLRRVTLPGVSGLSKKEFASAVKVSFTKVAEYQRRGLVHFHGVVRLDGPEGPETMPPAWASTRMLDEAVRASAKRARIAGADGAPGGRVLKWGAQIDVQPIFGDERDGGLSAAAVAGYIAKYATKGAEVVGAADRPVTCRKCGGTGGGGACVWCEGSGLGVVIAELPIPVHARTLIATAWRLGGLPEFEGLRLRPWAHQCGFGGNFSTASRLYSITKREQQAERVAWQKEHAAKGAAALPEDAVVDSKWEFAGSGWSGVEADVAAGIREDIAWNREMAREALELETWRGGGEAA